ncbi:hypothetical protein PENSTE_c023G03529 [Penicillium steckii]|uniref:DUF3669 domain-containing protein n=1 Tax=Penicillium steckii TaxID=303698 RepID=A0A1V6SSZ7_9EURO|nr:hypothetical protein PENSTE_c023G03529 [Penicillium steckii]
MSQLDTSNEELADPGTSFSGPNATRIFLNATDLYSRFAQSGHFQPNLKIINEIGSGLQGSIFEIVGESYVFKKESPGNEFRSSNLRREHKTHCDVSTAFEGHSATSSLIHVPRPYKFISRIPGHQDSDVFWDEIFTNIPQDYRTRGDVVTMGRILPLPKIVRKALITYFCGRGRDRDFSITDIEFLLNNPSNKHCLARVYLGMTNGSIDSNTPAPLRNFPLNLGFMEEIEIDTHTLAREMGKAYATLHWGAATNGDDIEFVLGTSTLEQPGTSTTQFQQRAVGLYLLDFGQCKAVDLTQDSDVVYQAFKGAMVTGDNQLFIPHASTNPGLFATFKKGYIDAGSIILSDKCLDDKFSLEDFMQEYEEYAEDLVY